MQAGRLKPVIYLHLKRSVALQLNKLESSSPKSVLYQVWLELVQSVWKKSFWMSSVYFLEKGRGDALTDCATAAATDIFKNR